MRHLLVGCLLLLGLVMLGGCDHAELMQGAFGRTAGPILFISNQDGSDQLYSMNVDGSNVQQLTFESDKPVASARWAPDGRSILLGFHRPEVDWLNGFDLRIVAPDGLTLKKLFTEEEINRGVSGRWPVWSEDSRSIYYGHYNAKHHGVAFAHRYERDGDAFISMWPSSDYRSRVITDTSLDGQLVMGRTRRMIKDETGRSHQRGYLTVWTTRGDSLWSHEIDHGSVSLGIWDPTESRVAMDARRYIEDWEIFLGVLDLDSGGWVEWSYEEFKQVSPVAWSRDGKSILARANGIYKDPNRMLMIDSRTGVYEDISPFKDSDVTVQSWRLDSR